MKRPGKYVIEARRKRPEGQPWRIAHALLGDVVKSEHQYRDQAEGVLEHWSKHHPRVALLGWFELRLRIVERAEGDNAPAPLLEDVPAKPAKPLPPRPVMGGEEGAPSIADLARAAREG